MPHIHTIKLDGDDNFTKNFNTCTEYYLISIDDSRTQEERDAAALNYFQLKLAMEQGYANYND
jgi:hypothetical protein